MTTLTINNSTNLNVGDRCTVIQCRGKRLNEWGLRVHSRKPWYITECTTARRLLIGGKFRTEGELPSCQWSDGGFTHFRAIGEYEVVAVDGDKITVEAR